MLTYKLIKAENGEYMYYYYPEGNLEAPGIVKLCEDVDSKIIQRSEDDPYGFYSTHALYNIPIGKKSGTVAWY